MSPQMQGQNGGRRRATNLSHLRMSLTQAFRTCLSTALTPRLHPTEQLCTPTSRRKGTMQVALPPLPPSAAYSPAAGLTHTQGEGAMGCV